MFQRKAMAILVSSVCAVGSLSAAEQVSPLKEIQVLGEQKPLDQSGLNRNDIERKNPRDVKALFADQLEVSANNLQGTRSGNDGVNVRGLQGNRVALSVDGVPLPETQENKLFVSLGMDFGRGDFIEPTALRSAQVQHSGSAQALSGSVNFATLEPQDLIQSGNLGGFIATGYDSLDRSIVGSLAGAAQNERYQGLALITGRVGNETRNKGSVGGEGDSRTKPNPADYRNQYVLIKNRYQVDDQNAIKLIFEHQQKRTETDLLSKNGTVIDQASGMQTSGWTDDKIQRTRLSLGHLYQNADSVIRQVESHLYLQNASSENHRLRESARGFRRETAEVKDKSYGFRTDLLSTFDTAIPQAVRYGLNLQYSDLSNKLHRQTLRGDTNDKPSPNTKQTKISAYLEDSLAFGSWVVTPQIGVLHYRLKPSESEGYHQWASELAPVKTQQRTLFLPKLTLAWQGHNAYQPYVQYSRGVKTPSAQQLTSSYGGSYGPVQYAVVGNPNLRPETADNFELGVKGESDRLQYRVAGYYNRYQNFIDWQSQPQRGYMSFIQYQNLDKAKIYGVTAETKWAFYDAFNLLGGIAYAKGKATHQGTTKPLNSIQPLKLRAGLAYEGEQFGASVQLTHIRAKSNKDIDGTAQPLAGTRGMPNRLQQADSVYNPSRSVNLLDLGVYWKLTQNLSLIANVNNLLDKKYWNWNDIAYFATAKSSVNGDRTMAINEVNADSFTAPGRNYNVGLKYTF